MTNEQIEIRECTSVEELGDCVAIQREVFALPEIEISPVRHLIVTKNAGGFTLGAFAEEKAKEKLVGFLLSVPAFFGSERFFYSHMMAVKKDFQSCGIGAKLKWAQRRMALAKGANFIKWTFQPVQARNAFFNLNKLGAIVRHYEPNFYGTDYSTVGDKAEKLGLDSDRLFAEWQLESEKVKKLSEGEKFVETGEVVQTIEIPNDWNNLAKVNLSKAIADQTRIKEEFQAAFAKNLVCRAFKRDTESPKYLIYKN